MKKKILGTVLLSAVVFSNLSVAPIVLAADEDSVGGSGSVTVEQGSIVPPDPNPDPTVPKNPGDSKNPEDPGSGSVTPDIPGTHNPGGPGDGFTPGTNDGPLSILGTSNLKFPAIKVSTSDQRKAAQAAQVFVKQADGSFVAKPVGNYVQFGDVRINLDGYDLSATMTQDFVLSTETNKTTPAEGSYLKNAKVVYTNGILTHEDANKSGVTHPTFAAQQLELSKAAGKQPVLSLAKADPSNRQGKGIYSVVYGQSNNLNESSVVSGTIAKGTEGNSVFLDVPGATAKNIKTGSYVAEITWDLTPAVK